jgi:type II secretory pathway pseudopilin PulG
MKLRFPKTNLHLVAAFTMVEIAICLAIIGFALVAIIGVLPFGMRVQKDNREETIINQDAMYWMETIRNGTRGLDHLTNYVQYIVVHTWSLVYSQGSSGPNGSGWVTTSTPQTHVYTNRVANSSIRQPTPVPGPAEPIVSGDQIVGLLSTPRFGDGATPTTLTSNYVFAYLKAISGPAVDKGRNSASREFAFHYRLVPEIYPANWLALQNFDWSQTNGSSTNQIQQVLAQRNLLRTTSANLHELRLLFRWPVLLGPDPDDPTSARIGSGRQSYRTLVSGRLDALSAGRDQHYFFQPSSYRTANAGAQP